MRRSPVRRHGWPGTPSCDLPRASPTARARRGSRARSRPPASPPRRPAGAASGWARPTSSGPARTPQGTPRCATCRTRHRPRERPDTRRRSISTSGPSTRAPACSRARSRWGASHRSRSSSSAPPAAAIVRSRPSPPRPRHPPHGSAESGVQSSGGPPGSAHDTRSPTPRRASVSLPAITCNRAPKASRTKPTPRAGREASAARRTARPMAYHDAVTRSPGGSCRDALCLQAQVLPNPRPGARARLLVRPLPLLMELGARRPPKGVRAARRDPHLGPASAASCAG